MISGIVPYNSVIGGRELSKRIVSAALFAMLAAGLFAGALRIEQVKAEGAIRIRADGSIDPPTAPIFTADNVTYTLSGNITAGSTDGIVIQRNSAVLDGAGFAITGKMLANSNGIVLDHTEEVTVKNVSVGSFRNGIYGNTSNGGHITETSLMCNDYGIYLFASEFNNIDGNNISQNAWAGIWLDMSQDNNITRNRLVNSLANNFGGIVLHDLSNDNNILENCITANKRYGIYIENCWSNTICHNNFTNNFFQAYVDPLTSQTNTWDNGYPSGGNYWSDYYGVDVKSGPNQNQLGSDGIGDTPYIIDSNNKDNYPLMQPWIPRVLVTFSDQVVGRGGNPIPPARAVLTVDGTNYAASDLPVSFLWNVNSVHSFSYASPLTVSGDEQCAWASTTGLSTAQSDSLTVTGSGTVTGNYVIQYHIAFDQTGLGRDFTGIVVTIDGANCDVTNLPAVFWWAAGSNHSLSFASPLVMNSTTQYVWNSTFGLSSLQSDTLVITASGSLVGNYILQNIITFDQVGVGSDFIGTVLVVDGTPCNITELPVSFYWTVGSTHTFGYESALIVTANIKRYVWKDTTGLSSVQSGYITVTTYETIMGGYKIQYYLTLATSPSGIDSPSEQGWHDAGSYAPISTTQYVDIMSGSARYQFTGWTTTDMTDFTDSSLPTTTVLMDEAKTVTANYATQYSITFTQSGVGSDFSGTVVTIDGTNYGVSDLPAKFWWDAGSSHTFASQSILTVNAIAKQYFLTSTSASSPYTVSAPSTVTGTYKTQYYVSFAESPPGSGSTNPTGTGIWEDAGPLPVSATANSDWIFLMWTSNTSSITFLNSNSSSTTAIISGDGTIAANFSHHDVAVTNVTSSKSVVGRGYATYINVTVANEGDFTETFNVTVYANATVIDTQQTTSMDPTAEFTLTFTWNTTSLAYGNFSISAYAWPVPGENNTANNNCTCNVPVHVGVPGDVSSSTPEVYDLRANMRDIAYLVSQFNTKPNSPSWNPNADVNDDGVCNMKDIAIALADFNQHE